MKKRYLNIVVLHCSSACFRVAVTGPNLKRKTFEMPGNDYYENLRAYKRSEHSVASRLVWRLDGCRGFDGGQSDGASLIVWTSFRFGVTGKILMRPGCWTKRR